MHYHREYGIFPRQVGRPLATDYYTADHRVTFDRISELTGLSTELISTFNPQFRRGIIPGNNSPYPVRLPLSAILKLDSAGSEVHSPELRVNLEGPNNVAPPRAIAKSKPAENEEPAPVEEAPRPSKRKKAARKQESTTTTHTIVTGETLYAIAHKNGISVEELKKSNNLTSDNLQPGQQLQIKKGTKANSEPTQSKGKSKAHNSKKGRRGRR